MLITTRSPNLARLSLVAIVLGGDDLVAGTILVFITQFVAASAGVEPASLALVVTSLIPLQGITFGDVALAYTKYHGLDRSYFGVSISSLRDLVAVVLDYVTAFVAAFVDALLVSTFDIQAGSNQVTEIAAQDPGMLLLLVPAPFLLIGPGGELLLHGAVRNRTRESFGPVPGITPASAIFAAIHCVTLTGGAGDRLATIGILFLLNVVFDMAYGLTDNITAPVLVHGVYNATLFSLAYLVFKLAEMSPGGVPTGLLF